ncbi:MAG: T9SS type A sorting domain-containing protein [candidate division Zixibacteria bacterium]|nr:T9SS type A sorting domain-containing protein [candidate division Zixibacteria bacterium]
MIYVDGFVVTGGEVIGTATSIEISTLTEGTIDPVGLVAQSLTATAATTGLSGVLEVPEGSDLDLLLLDPSGNLVSQSSTAGPTEVVRFTPSALGPYSFQVLNKKAALSPYTLYLITTEQAGTSPKAIGDADIDAQRPLVFSLSQNYPNPFNAKTVIRYALPAESQVQLKLYNLLGQEVASLVNARQPAGNYQISFTADKLASGVYFYKLKADEEIAVKKMMVVK